MASGSAMTTRQIFNLRWNNHTNNMLQVFLEQLANETLVDVTLSCEGKFLKVHRMVLFACSPYFQELFLHHKEQNPVIILKGLKFEDLKSVVNFMYCGEIEVAEPEMEGVLAVAEALEIKGLSDVRESYENRNRKSTASEEEDDGGGIQECGTVSGGASGSGRCSRGYTRKKRKFSEGGPHVDPISREDSEAGNNSIADNLSLPVMSSEEGRLHFSPEIHVKEEVRDSDGEATGQKSEEKDWRPEDWARGSEQGPTPNVASEVKGYSSGVISGVDKASVSEIIPTRHILPEPMSENTVLDRVCKGMEAMSPLTLGNTARKTMMCSQGRCKIPRPPNAFMVFANEWRRKLAVLHHGETNKDISVRLGAMWKELPPDAKESYFAAARRADQEHKMRYPGYIYSPKEARMRKILRRVAVKHNSRGTLISVSPGSDLASRETVLQLPPSSDQKKQQ